MSSSEKRLNNKVAIVTGAGSGFGREIALKFAAEGAHVVIADINDEGAAETAKQASGETQAIHMDVTSALNWKEAVEMCVGRWGRVDVVVNNAGWSYKNKPTLEVTAEEWARCFDINVKSVFNSVPAVVPQMQKQGGGSIINISSIGSERPRPGLVWYNATKAAVSNATKALAAEYGPDQIRFNAVCPLLSGTGLFEAFVGVPYNEENVKKFVGQVPMGRLTDPKDVANLTLFLASDESSFVTGQNISVDGGKSI